MKSVRSPLGIDVDIARVSSIRTPLYPRDRPAITGGRAPGWWIETGSLRSRASRLIRPDARHVGVSKGLKLIPQGLTTVAMRLTGLWTASGLADVSTPRRKPMG